MKNRRILWVWGTVPSGIQTVPRELTYHPGLKRVVWNPAEEVAALRTAAPIATLPMTPLKAATAVSLKASAASDVELYLQLPKAAATIEVQIGTSGACYMDFIPGAGSLPVGYNATGKGKGPRDSVPMLGDEK